MAIERVLIPTESHDPDSIKLALAQGARISRNAGCAANLTILIHTKSHLDGALRAAIGDDLVKALKSNETVKLSETGDVLKLHTIKTLPMSMKQSVLIAFNADRRLLEAADDVRDILGIVAVPDLAGECDDWAKLWGAMVPGGKAVVAQAPITDSVVENALIELMGRINESTGISNVRDKEYADETLRILKAKDHTIDSAAIREWVISRGWNSKDANALAKLANRIGSLRNKPSTKKFYNADARYNSW